MLFLICLPVFLGALDLTIISAVLPAVLLDLNLPLQSALDEAAWAVTGYLLAYAVSMTFMGRVSDVWGRRRVYLICLGIFFVGSWWVAASGEWPAQLMGRLARAVSGGRPDASLMALYALIVGRVIQALGAGALVPVSMALVADMYPPDKRALPLGLIGAVDTAGWVLGHLYGGIVVQFFPWTALFWINLPIVAVLFGLIIWAMRRITVPRLTGRIDWRGALLISLALIGLNLGLGTTGDVTTAQLNASGTDAVSWPALTLGLVCFGVFLWAERRTPEPLLNLNVFAQRNVSVAGGLNLLIGFSLMVGLVSVPLFINIAGARDANEGALVSGYLLSAFTVPMALAAIPGGWLAGRVGYRWSTLGGLLLAVLGFGLMLRWQPAWATHAINFFAGQRSAEVWAGMLNLISGLLCAGIGLGLTIAPIGTAVINAVSAAERGMASALVIILRLVGMSVSVSVLTAYGLRRSIELSQQLLKGVALTDFARLAEAAIQAATQVTTEMALIALGVCGVGGMVALWLLPRDKGRGLEN